MPRKNGKTRVRPKRKNKNRTKSKRGKRYGKYRGGCKDCLGTNPVKQWISGGNPEQVSNDIYNYKTDPYFYASS
jgi:hypothetical protein